MVKLTVVPVIPLALSEAMKTATLAISASVKPSRVGLACEQILELFPGQSRHLGANLDGFLERACLRYRLWSQADHANALGCELGG